MVEQGFRRFGESEREFRRIDVSIVDRNSGLVKMQSEMDDRRIRINWQPDETVFLFFRSSDDDTMMCRPLLEDIAEPHCAFSDSIDTGS